jgi:hypothetical protein
MSAVEPTTTPTATPTATATATATPPSERFIVVPLYCRVGLYNQWISLQLAVTFAKLTGRTLILDLGFGFLNAGRDKQMFAHSGAITHSDLQITDLFDVPVPMRVYRRMEPFDQFMQTHAQSVYTPPNWPTCFLNAVIQVDALPLPAGVNMGTNNSTTDEQAFCEFQHRRHDIVNLADILNRPERIVRLRRAISGQDPASFYFAQPVSLFYSRDALVRADVAQTAASIQPKPMWVNIARGLSMQIARGQPSTDEGIPGKYFHAVHLRRGDKVNINPYIKNLRADWLVQQLRRTLCDDVEVDSEHEQTATFPLAVCTDSPSDPLIAALRDAFPHMVLVDDELEKHTSDILKTLPFGDDRIVKAFISSLTCTFSRRFLGTQGSTFSSYINHVRGIRGTQREPIYCYPNRTQPNEHGKWSWNRRNTEPRCIGWFVVHQEDWEHILSHQPHMHLYPIIQPIKNFIV